MFALVLTAVFVLLNGFFVAAEFSLVKLRATQLDRLAKRSDGASKATVEIFQQLSRYLSATQLGITLASLGLGWVGEPAVASQVEALATWLGVGGTAVSAGLVHSVAFGVGFAVLTSAHIIFGELLPKLIAIGSAEGVALRVARPLRWFYWLTYPGLRLLNGASEVLLRMLGYPNPTDAEGALSEEEILGVLAQAHARGRLSQHKRQLLERVMRFTERSARQVMVPRLDVISLHADLPVEDAVARARAQGFTRYPLAEAGDLDKIVGYVNIKDVVLGDTTTASLRTVMREALVVPETLGLFELMQTMQRRQTPLAIVVDEYGGTSGIATLEDVLEEIVGEIRDEHDEEAPRVEVRGDGAVVADGIVTIHDLRAHGVEIPDADADTIGGAVLGRLGRLARNGDEVRFEHYDVRVETVRRRRVGRVAIRRRAVA